MKPEATKEAENDAYAIKTREPSCKRSRVKKLLRSTRLKDAVLLAELLYNERVSKIGISAQPAQLKTNF